VTVTTAAVTETTVTRVIRRSTNPGETYRLVGTTLNIDATCGVNCSVTYEIKAPAGVAVHGRLNSGDIRLDGVGATDLEVTSGDLAVLNGAGPIQLRASSGDIKVLDAKGTVKAQTTSGDIQALNAAGAVDVRLSSGDATVVLATPASVTAKSTSGDINVTVPSGSYKVGAVTGAGDVDLHGMVSNPGAKDVLDVQTGSGDVNIAAAA
jgi:DUF4097 and DUF4098 domain-containing protein YvlB